MLTSEQGIEIAKDYLNKKGFPDCEIVDVKDKIYKWTIETKSSSTTFIIELSKSDGRVLKFEVIFLCLLSNHFYAYYLTI